ncbi:MAG: SUMF1/EgtB/PvdO family nonheme iron enzyme [Candidatus Competibacteraceae bacterium]
MDIEKDLEKLAAAYAAGQLNEGELARRQEELLPTTGSEEGELPEAPVLDGSDSSDPEGLRSTIAETGLAALEVGLVIGPPERRVRLLHDLSGKGRVWLVRGVLPATRGTGELADDFRAIKILLPLGQVPGLRDPGRDERGLRADLIGLRAYLTKAKARVERAARLAHPHIASVYGWWCGADGWPFAEMEYLSHQQGRSLAQRLREQGQNGLPWETVLKWLRPVANALDYARREHRLAHQHLDADAVFITDQGMVKVLGFGLATEVREPSSLLFSLGDSEPDYATMEGATESISAETFFRRDGFALALLVYQSLAGQSAYEAQGQSSNPLPRPTQLTDEAWQVLRNGLAYPTELCPIDAGGFMEALETAQQSSFGSRRARGVPLNRGGWLMVVSFLAVLTVGGYWLVTGVGDAPETTPIARDRPAETETGAEIQALETPASQDPGVQPQDVEREADVRSFEAAKRVDTLPAYQLYLQRCPNCGHELDARAAIQRLENQEIIARLKAEFDRLAEALEREQRGDRGDEALSRLEALGTLVPDDPLLVVGRQRLARGWAALVQESLDSQDLAKARNWLKKAESVQPKQLELAKLARVLDQAEAEARLKQSDAEAFAVARRQNTRKAYWAYLDQCGAICHHRAAAEAALTGLAPALPVLRDRLSDGSQGPEMVALPAGVFRMGSPPREKSRYNDEQQRSVRLNRPFAIGRYEVMFHEYDRFAIATGRSLPDDQGWGRGRRPVINVAWRDAVAYAAWLSEQTGHRYRLPTEAEWEYAARGGVAASRFWGDDPNEGCAYANAADLDGKQLFIGWTVMNCYDGHVYTAPVGSYRNNDFGLHDMLGNVLEWTCSLYDKDFVAPVQTCQEPVADRQFVVRGGSWNDEPRNVRSADRHRSRPDFQDYFLGFRLVRELP